MLTPERANELKKKLKDLENEEYKKFPKSKISYSNKHGSVSTKPDDLIGQHGKKLLSRILDRKRSDR